MLLPENIHPEQSIYYNGAIVLKILQKQNKQNIVQLYETVKQERNMSFAVFLLCLDWLYLINVAILNTNGDLELCS